MDKVDRALEKIFSKIKHGYRLRFFLREKIIHNESLYLKYSRLKYPDATVCKETDITIEGYMRSGNTFSYYAFKNLNPKLKIANRRHSNVQIKYSLRNNIPVILLIRNPLDVITSNYIFFDKKVPFKEIAKSWINFYKPLLLHKNDLIVSDFNKTINEFDDLVLKVNKFYKKNFFYEKINEQLIFDDIKRNQPIKNFQKLPMPNEQTKKNKEHLKKQFLEHNDSIIEECFTVYNKFIN